MIDLHTHILPGIDDGVKTEDDAVAFARMAVEDGITTIVATPHCKDGFYVNTRDEVLGHVERLRTRLAAESIPLTLVPGAEVHICEDLVGRIRDGRAPTLADNGTTLLLELSLSQYPVELQSLVFQLKLAGIEILVAHPERIRYFQDDVTRYEEMVRLGAHGQVTSGSLTGRFGESAQEFAEELVRKGLVNVIASDAHNIRGRPPVLGPSVAAAAALVGEARARAMVTDAPRALLEGRAPEIPEVERPRASGGFLSRMFRRGDGT